MSHVHTTKFSLTSLPFKSFIFSCSQFKLTLSFSLTRSLVQKLVMPAFKKEKLFVCTASKENWTRNCALRHCSLRTSSSRKTCPVVHTTHEQIKLVKENLRKKLVHCTHEQVKLPCRGQLFKRRLT